MTSDEFQIRIDERQSEFRGGEKLLPFNGISQLPTLDFGTFEFSAEFSSRSTETSTKFTDSKAS